MFDIVALWCGRIMLIIVIISFTGFSLFLIIKGISILLRKPYYCIKRLLPWKWITEKEYVEIVERVGKNPKFPNAKLIRKGRFGNLYIPNKINWWDAKNHFFFVKKY